MGDNSFVKYADLLNVKGADPETNKEKFVFLPAEGEYVFGRYGEPMMDMAGKSPYLPVRKTVAEKLVNVGKRLKAVDPNYKLLVAYAFREMRIQQAYFDEVFEVFKDQFDDELELYERIHERVAVPTVAGHPTGGAVDVAIYDESKGDIVDFGTALDDLTTDLIYYAAEDISDEAKANRKLLRDAMMAEGFAPYDGEWWHFCYGDKEWAFYYKKDRALYDQVYSLEDIDIEE